MMDEETARRDTTNASHGWAGRSEDLDSMSVEELEEQLDGILDGLDEGKADMDLIKSYLDAMDKKGPPPVEVDVDAAYARFKRSAGFAEPKPCRVRGALRLALVAVAAVAVVLGAMVTVQATGTDVFGAIARWTEEVFSFGNAHLQDVHDTPKENGEPSDNTIHPNTSDKADNLQAALDQCGITEVKAPTWLPEGYELTELKVTDQREFGVLYVDAEYTASGAPTINANISLGPGTFPSQIQIENASADSFEENGITFHSLKNDNNFSITWTSQQYECQVYGENEEYIRHIVSSML